VLLRPSADGTIWVGPGRPQPGLFAARYAEVLADGSGRESPLISELRRRAESAAGAGVSLAEVAGRDASEPNASLRPSLTRTVLDPHGPPEDSLRDACLILGPQCRLWLTRQATPGVVAPVYNSAADIGATDGCSRLLMRLAMGHGWDLTTFRFPVIRPESTPERHFPRLLLPNGAVLAPERWMVDEDALRRILALRGAARYLAWRREAERLDLPDLVYARFRWEEPEILFPADSPLGVQGLFDRIAREPRWLILTEWSRDPARWPLRDSNGDHYLAELAATWYADGYWAAAAPTSTLADAP
jgi:hypothetical protein